MTTGPVYSLPLAIRTVHMFRSKAASERNSRRAHRENAFDVFDFDHGFRTGADRDAIGGASRCPAWSISPHLQPTSDHRPLLADRLSCAVGLRVRFARA